MREKERNMVHNLARYRALAVDVVVALAFGFSHLKFFEYFLILFSIFLNSGIIIIIITVVALSSSLLSYSSFSTLLCSQFFCSVVLFSARSALFDQQTVSLSLSLLTNNVAE